MSRPSIAITSDRVDAARQGLDHLRQAASNFREAGCPRTVKLIREALSSAESATNNAKRTRQRNALNA